MCKRCSGYIDVEAVELFNGGHELECQVLSFAGDLQDLINDNVEEEEEEGVEKEAEERKKKRKKRSELFVSFGIWKLA